MELAEFMSRSSLIRFISITPQVASSLYRSVFGSDKDTSYPQAIVEDSIVRFTHSAVAYRVGSF